MVNFSFDININIYIFIFTFGWGRRVKGVVFCFACLVISDILLSLYSGCVPVQVVWIGYPESHVLFRVSICCLVYFDVSSFLACPFSLVCSPEDPRSQKLGALFFCEMVLLSLVKVRSLYARLEHSIQVSVTSISTLI